MPKRRVVAEPSSPPLAPAAAAPTPPPVARHLAGLDAFLPALKLPLWAQAAPAQGASPAQRPSPPRPSSGSPTAGARAALVEAAQVHAAALAGGGPRSTREEIVVELARFAPKKQRHLKDMCLAMRDQAGEGDGPATLAWLRALSRADYRLARELSDAVAHGGVERLPESAFRALLCRLQALEVARQADCAAAAGRILALSAQDRARSAEIFEGVIAHLSAAPSGLKQQQLATFLMGAIPADKLNIRQLGRAVGLLAGLDETGRRWWGETFEVLAGNSDAGRRGVAKFFRLLGEVGAPAARLEVLASAEVQRALFALPGAAPLETANALLELTGDLRRAAGPLLSVGGGRRGPQGLRRSELVAVAGQARVDRSAETLAAFVEAADAVVRAAPAGARLALVRVVAQAEGPLMGEVGGALVALLGHVASALAARRGQQAVARAMCRLSDDLLALDPSALACHRLVQLAPALGGMAREVSGEALIQAVGHLVGQKSLPAVQAPRVMRAAHDLAEERRDLVPSLVEVIAREAPSLEARGLDAAVAFARPFARLTLAEEVAPLIDGLWSHVAGDQAAAFSAALAPLLAEPPPAAMAGYVIDYCARAPDGDGRGGDTWAARVERVRAFHPNQLLDLENVQSAPREHRTYVAARALRARWGRPSAHQLGRTGEALRAYLDGWASLPSSSPASAALGRVRAGATEYAHARRLLFGPPQSGDRTFVPLLGAEAGYEKLRLSDDDRVPLDHLCHWVHSAVEQHPGPHGCTPRERDQERDNLRYSLMMALARSVDEGHGEQSFVVCPMGISQRLLQVLQGYDKHLCLDAESPQQLLSALGEAFAKKAGDAPPPAAVVAFRSDALAQAARTFPPRGADLATFTRDLDAFLRLQYDLDPPAAAA